MSNYLNSLLLKLKEYAEQGCPKAQCELAHKLIYYYYHGDYHSRGVEEDLKEAFKLYKKAAKQGLATAQYRLALCYDSGEGVKKDLGKAFIWYEKAAEQGHEAARFSVRMAYCYGWGVEKNPGEAERLWEKELDKSVRLWKEELGLS